MGSRLHRCLRPLASIAAYQGVHTYNYQTHSIVHSLTPGPTMYCTIIPKSRRWVEPTHGNEAVSSRLTSTLQSNFDNM